LLFTSVPYAALVNAYEKIEATSKRLEIQEIMTTFFSRILEKSPDNLLEMIYLCINRVSYAITGWKFVNESDVLTSRWADNVYMIVLLLSS